MSKRKPIAHALLTLTGKRGPYLTGILVCTKVVRGTDGKLPWAKRHIKEIFTEKEAVAAEAEALQYHAAMTGLTG